MLIQCQLKVMKKYFKGKKYLGWSPHQLEVLTTNVIMNYVIYKTGGDWKSYYKVFVEDAKVAKRVYFSH